MYYVDIPSAREIGDLNLIRNDACVSIYLPTTPLSRETGPSRISLGNLIKKAVARLEAAGLEESRITSFQDQFDELLVDDEFWNHQANSLALLATPESLRTYRLANKLSEIIEVSDRFHLKPLLRATTFEHAAHVLAISEKAVRLIEISADLPARVIDVPDLPADLTAVVGEATARGHSGIGHVGGEKEHKSYLTRYIRKINEALRPIILQSDRPLILATTSTLETLFRSTSNVPVLPEIIAGNPDHLSESALATAARPLLDTYHAGLIQQFHRLFEERMGQNRATTDILDAARLATHGGIDRLMMDIDSDLEGFVDDATGEVTFGSQNDVMGYGVVDEIASRALRTGAKLMAVRRDDIPGRHELAVISRYPLG